MGQDYELFQTVNIVRLPESLINTVRTVHVLHVHLHSRGTMNKRGTRYIYNILENMLLVRQRDI
jgi:hypothetical protein